MFNPKIYKLLEQCVEDGVMLGKNRAEKYEIDPSNPAYQEYIINAIMNEICEWFDFDTTNIQ